MANVRQAFFGITVATAIALLPMAPAMAGGGHGFRPHGFGLGRGIVGAAVALATLPLAIAAAVVSGGEPLYYAAPHVYYGPRPYYAAHPNYYGHGYYRAGGNSYPHR